MITGTKSESKLKYSIIKDKQAENLNWKIFNINRRKYLQRKYCHFLTCLSFYVKCNDDSDLTSSIPSLKGNYSGNRRSRIFQQIANNLYASKNHRKVKKTFKKGLKIINNYLKITKNLSINYPSQKEFVLNDIKLSMPFCTFDFSKPNFSMTKDDIPILSYKEFLKYVNKIK
jgi:hypothetical protein